MLEQWGVLLFCGIIVGVGVFLRGQLRRLMRHWGMKEAEERREQGDITGF